MLQVISRTINFRCFKSIRECTLRKITCCSVAGLFQSHESNSLLRSIVLKQQTFFCDTEKYSCMRSAAGDAATSLNEEISAARLKSKRGKERRERERERGAL